MNEKIENKLIRRFPILYQDHNGDPHSTLMCFGFSHSDGWEKIIWELSLGIEKELNYSWLQKTIFMLKKRISRDWNQTVYRISPPRTDDFLAKFMKRFFPAPLRDKDNNYFADWRLKAGLGLKNLVWWPNTGFAVVQVKEKYGTLRYYTNGHNDAIEKLISKAEAQSAKTCEQCGKKGKMRIGGWYRVLCNECQFKRDLEDGTVNGIERAKIAIKEDKKTK